MEVFEKNKDSLINYHSELIKRMENNISEDKGYEVYISGKGFHTLKVKNDEKKYIHITSPYDPIKQSKQIIDKLDFNRNRGVIFIIGIGLGYQIEEALERINDNTIIVVVEENMELFKEVLALKDFSKAIDEKKIFFAVGEGDNILEQLKGIMNYLAFHIVHNQIVNFNIYNIKYGKFLNKVVKYVRTYSDAYYFSLGNDLDDTLVGMKNRFDNMARYIKNPGLNDVIDKYGEEYKNKPAIIVASGPSLDKNIKELKNAVGKALILSCDGSVTALAKEGIVPDSMGSVERIYKTYEAFYKDKDINSDIVFTSPAVVRKEIVDCFNNKFLSFFKAENLACWIDDALFNRKGTVWSGASVSHMLYGLAHRLGCDPIILVGQDLAYSEDGVSHVDSAEVKESVDLKKVDVYVKGINGKMIPSTYIWEKFLVTYKEGVRTSDRVTIDATEGGALIDGTEIATLRDTIEKYCIDKVTPLRKAVDSIDVEQEYIDKAKISIIDSTKSEIEKFIHIHKISEESLESNIKNSAILKRGIETQNELDKIYDCIENVENNIVSYIMKDSRMKMFFQFLVFRCAYDISNLKENTYTMDSIEKNLKSQKVMLKDIVKYSKKAISLYNWGVRKLEKID